MRPVVLAIGGSDPTGGAGIQGDIKTIEAHGCHAATAITSVTTQTLSGFTGRHDLEEKALASQIEAAITSFPVAVLKTGMLPSRGHVEVVARAAREHLLPCVVDPVLASTTGGVLSDEAAQRALVQTLFAHAVLVTPNRQEAAALSGIAIRGLEDARTAADVLAATGARNFWIKSAEEDATSVTDLIVSHERTRMLRQEKSGATIHGTGCALASSVACHLARGASLDDAIDGAAAYVQTARRHAWTPGAAPQGLLSHFAIMHRDASRAPALAAVGALASVAERERWTNLLPEVGSNIVFLVENAETTGDVATLAGRLVPVNGALRVTGGPTFRPSSHMARFLLAIHGHDAQVGVAMNTRYDDEVAVAFRQLEWDVAYFDRAREPADAKAREGGTMPWGAAEAMRGRSAAPDVVVDLGEIGKECLAKVLARTPRELEEKLRRLHRALLDPASR